MRNYLKTNDKLDSCISHLIKRTLQVAGCALMLSSVAPVFAQKQDYWHGKERELRYKPDGRDFVIENGKVKFNKALYGTHTAFRVETSDVPEFGFFMPNMGGNMQIGIALGNKSIWLSNADYVKSIYRAGTRIYEIKDPILANGSITISVLAMGDTEGMVMKIETHNLPVKTELLTIYGGASNKRFSRNGDLGVDDPDGFGLKPENCENNFFDINNNLFSLSYGKATRDGAKVVYGTYPDKSELKQSSSFAVGTPLEAWNARTDDDRPIIISKTSVAGSGVYYFAIKPDDGNKLQYADLSKCFDQSEQKRKEIAETITIDTPDPYFNTLGGVLATAADGIWDEKVWQHGAIGWRMPLNGWRAAYVGDVLGWNDRARTHFDGYAASQIKTIPAIYPHPTQDQTLNLTRADKKWGTQMYSNGYICRNPYDTSKMHHYNMNLCYIDELLWHFNWTGDMDYVRKMWPTVKLHLEWEKRNYDPNDDGLYDAYACIWASDALQYNSGSVTHSTAYNYRSNKMAAEIARKLGEDPAPYEKEAEKILNAVNSTLWLADKGWWAEYQDFMGNKMIHPNAGVWSIYHAMDGGMYTPFQAYQATRYVDEEIPHIPVLAKGLKDEGYETISTTNWLPYSWSINNVAFAEVANTSLAYWQAGRYDEAFKLFKSNILDGMYLGSTPGNIGQISFYDAARGECYRDFGDPVGVYSRTLVQGLFGILPDAMNNRLEIRPGYPSSWDHAAISTSYISFDFKRNANTDTYIIDNKFEKQLSVNLVLNAVKDGISYIKVNGKNVSWTLIDDAINAPRISVDCGFAAKYTVEIVWSGNSLKTPTWEEYTIAGESWVLSSDVNIIDVYDPQGVLSGVKNSTTKLNGEIVGEVGHRTLFVRLEQGQMKWWKAVEVEIANPFDVAYNAESDKLQFTLKNNSKSAREVSLLINSSDKVGKSVKLPARTTSPVIEVPAEYVKLGTNELIIKEKGKEVFSTRLMNWNLKNDKPVYEMVVMDGVLNASVSQIFKNEYLTPRSPYTTLQTPKQGIGEWCHPNLNANIDDSGIRAMSKNSTFNTPFGIPFRTTEVSGANNIAFTTLWDNYPEKVSVPLKGKASHVYLMMAGSTSHMQCHVPNGKVTVYYKDGTTTSLDLVNPENWVPIEQDFFIDGEAFASKDPRPYRVAFKSGLVSRDMEKDLNIKPTAVYERNIDGGAGIIVDLPLNKNKELNSIEVKTIANEVVVGLMSVTLLK